MAYIINQSCGDFQLARWLPVQANQWQHSWAPEHSWTSDRPKKQASAKADLLTFSNSVLAIGLLMELSIDSENCS